MTNRRTYLRRLGAGVGLALLAGCVDEDAAENNDNSDGDQSDEEPSDNGGPAGDTTATMDAPPAVVDDALRERDTQNYDGEIVTNLDADTVEITVGGGENGLAFDPPVVQVAPGTEVTWRWSGNGGAHNVLAMDPEGAFDSGDPVDEQETTYSATFEEEGNYLYACQPHRSIGMWGAVVVGEGGDAGPSGANDDDSEPSGANDGDSEPSEPDYDSPKAKADAYLRENEANQYDGEFADFTGQNSVTISVGGGDGLSFDPPAMVVDPGTEIVWEWTGEGGAHNVVSAEESASEFDSGEIVQSDTRTYTTVVEETGAYLYYCAPHQAVGMFGAIVVEE